MSRHCLMFYAGIDNVRCANLLTYLVDLQRGGATKLTIAMSSPGGNVNAGITMHNHLRSMPFEIEIHNIGNIDSIANAVFLGSPTRSANPSATFMFHGIAFDGTAGERLDERKLLEKLDVITADHERTARIIAQNSNLSPEAALELFKEQRTVSAEWALNNGLVQELRDFVVPEGTDLKHIT